MLDSLADTGRSGVVVTGPVGIGKSRLLSEAASQLAALGWPSRSLALSRAGSDVPLAALAEFAPSDDGDALREAIRGATTALRALARAAGRRVVLVVDDGRLLDEASTTILHGLARDGVVAVLVGVSGTAAVPRWVQSLTDDPTMIWLELQPLDRAGVDRLATEALGGPISGLLSQELWRLSRGVPRVLRALLRGGQQDDLLAETDGRWRHTGPLAGSAAVRSLLTPNLERLTGPERTAVELLALAGRTELDLIAHLVGDEPLAALENGGMVEVEESGVRAEARITSALLADALRHGLTRTQRRWLARHLADALEALGLQRGEDGQRVALWRLDGGQPADVDDLLRSSARARARLEIEHAERLARSAFLRRRCWRTHLHLAQCLSLQRKVSEADHLLVTAAQHAPADDARLLVATARADNLLFSAGRSRSAVAVLDEVRTCVATPDGAPVLAGRTAIALGYDDPRGCELLVARLPPPGGGDPSTGLVLALAHGLARLVRGDAAGALAVAEEVLAPTVGGPSDAPVIELRLRQLRVRALLLLGRFADAEQVARADHDTALAHGTPHHAAASAAQLGLVLLERGQPGAASELLTDACATLRACDPLALLAVCLAARAYAAALLGDTVVGTALLEEARQLSAPLQPLTIWAGRADCWLLAQQGTVAAGAATALAVATQARGPMLWYAELLHDVTRLGHTDSAAPLAALARSADSDLIATMAAHASALTGADPPALMIVADRFAAMGADLAAAEAQAQATGLLRAAGRNGPAGHAGARATVLAERCSPVTTPALLGDLVRLTAREREVALQVAAGRSSREVADRLTVSVRTVDNHLYRVYAKLGITGRSELADALYAPASRGGSELTGPPGRAFSHQQRS